MNISICPKYPNFRHAGELAARFDKLDPRQPSFTADRVDIDLRGCDFVWPSAALWCVVYLALARKRGVPCRLLVPANMGACVHLKSLRLFETLQARDVEVDDRGVRSHDESKTVLGITHFETTGDAVDITNRAFDRLCSANLGSPNLNPVVSELFSELALNAAEHSESEMARLPVYSSSSSRRVLFSPVQWLMED